MIKTKITSKHKNTCISLVVDNKGGADDRFVLASMALFEGTGCWMMNDIRLCRIKKPSLHSCGFPADEFCSSIMPTPESDAAIVRNLLREYQVQPNGEILWCTFDGIPRGQPMPNGDNPWHWANFHQSGYFSRKEGMEYLENAKAFYAAYEGDYMSARIDNPNRQPTFLEMSGAICIAHQNPKNTSDLAMAHLSPAGD